jgi:TonB family protein
LWAPLLAARLCTASAAEPSPEPPAEVVDPAAIIALPSVTTWVEAEWPAGARESGLTAEVGLAVTLSAEGLVTEIAVIRPAGLGFDEAAATAVRAMGFEPARTAGGPVGVVFEFTYRFVQSESDAPPAEAPVNLEGRVREMATRRPVELATVILSGTAWQTTTDAEGRFSFRGVPAGAYKVEIVDVDHLPISQDLTVAEGTATSAELWMERAGTDNEIYVTYVRERPEVTQHSVSMAEIKKIPGTFGDPVKVIQTLPGAARSPFGTGLLIIRGANPEDTAVYVDGIRVPIIYHLTGTTSVISPDAVEGVDYLPGGYGVNFGRSTAGTVNVRTKTKFDDRRLVWSTDVLDSQVWFETNVGKNKQHGLAFGARRSYIDLLLPAFNPTEFQIQPIYWDYQAKWVPQLGDKDKFSAFVYGFQDILRVSSPDDVAQGADQDTQGDLETRYQSHRIVLRYHHDFSDKLSFDFDPSFGIDMISLGLGSEFGLDNRNLIFQLRSELIYKPHPAVEIIPGLDMIAGPWQFDFRSAVSFADLDDPLAERDAVGFDGKGTAWSPDVYVRTNIRPVAANRDKLILSAGVRSSSTIYVYGGGITFGEDLAPTTIQGFDGRLAGRYQVFETDTGMTGVVKASTGWYTQPPQPFESLGLGVRANLSAERAWNSSLGFEHRVSQAVSWSLEGFYRRMDRLAEFNDSFTGAGSQPFSSTGEGYSTGFELMLRHAPANRFFGWLSYTFSRSFRRDGSADSDGVWYPFDYDQPHIFSAQGGYEFPKGFSLSAQFQVVSGNPTTPFDASVYDVDGDFYNGFQTGQGNSSRLPTFVQTSFRVDKTWTFRMWQFELYLDLINAVRGVNPEATLYNYDYSESAFLRGLPFIPNLGFEMRFWP